MSISGGRRQRRIQTDIDDLNTGASRKRFSVVRESLAMRRINWIGVSAIAAISSV
jgi:hypothetical protein